MSIWSRFTDGWEGPTFLVLFLTLLAAAYYGLQARLQVLSTRRGMEASLRPVIALDTRGSRRSTTTANRNVITLSVTNIGPGPALNVKALSDPIDKGMIDQFDIGNVGAQAGDRDVELVVPADFGRPGVSVYYFDVFGVEWRTNLPLIRIDPGRGRDVYYVKDAQTVRQERSLFSPPSRPCWWKRAFRRS